MAARTAGRLFADGVPDALRAAADCWPRRPRSGRGPTAGPARGAGQGRGRGRAVPRGGRRAGPAGGWGVSSARREGIRPAPHLIASAGRRCGRDAWPALGKDVLRGEFSTRERLSRRRDHRRRVGQSGAEVFWSCWASSRLRLRLDWLTARRVLPMEYSRLGLEHFTRLRRYFHGLRPHATPAAPGPALQGHQCRHHRASATCCTSAPWRGERGAAAGHAEVRSERRRALAAGGRQWEQGRDVASRPTRGPGRLPGATGPAGRAGRW